MTSSPEVIQKLRDYQALVEKWQGSINLISPGSLPNIWQRHIEDSLQLISLLPASSKKILDLGSGGGFPGIVLSIATNHEIHLVESDKRKSIFLKECIRSLDLTSQVHHCRIEDLHQRSDYLYAFDVITARACADLCQLLHYALPLLKPDAFCLFLKGENYTMELDKARQDWEFDLQSEPSRTDSTGVILRIRELRRKSS